MSKRCNKYNQSFKGLKIKFFKVLYLRTGCVRENAPPEQNKRSSIFYPTIIQNLIPVKRSWIIKTSSWFKKINYLKY